MTQADTGHSPDRTLVPTAQAALAADRAVKALADRYASHPGAWPSEADAEMRRHLGEHQAAGSALLAMPARTQPEQHAKAEALLTFLTMRQDGTPDGSLAEKLAFSLARDLLAS